MYGYSEKTICIVQFSGKKDNWWSKQFLALNRKKKYMEVLTGKTTVPAAATLIDVTATGGVEKQKARDNNKTAYHDLVQSNPNQIAFNIIDNATTTDLPNGDAALVWNESKSATNIVDCCINSVSPD